VRISPDQTYIAVGHASGNIHLWDLATPTKPARTTLALSPEQLKTGRKDGHSRGDAILQIGFVAARHTAIISGDSAGKVFWWSLGRVMGIESNDTIRILGGPKRSKLFAALPLPLGEASHSTDEAQISALLTPRKLVIVCMKPSPKTLHRRIGDGGVGCAAWLRPGELSATSDPVLAYSWDAQLHFLRVPSFVESRSYEASSPILALQWFDANVSFRVQVEEHSS
jgi:WD40 repeat protein